LFPQSPILSKFSLISGQFHPTLKESVISPLLKKPTLDKEELSKVTLKMHDLKMTDKENYGAGKCKSGK